MALEENVISPEETFFCGGSLTVADYNIHCHNRNGHGTLTLDGVLAQSCNVGMMRIMTKLGADKYLQYQKDFGFGEKTGIDLPGEASAAGLLYTKENLHSAEMATSSFGQGFNCTPMQAITAFAALVNGGKLMKPYIVSEILDRNDNVVLKNEPEVVRNVISKETSDYIRTALEEVLTEGTGKKAVIQGYAIGGKTGTAQQAPRSEQKYALSFIAYHSVENPNMMLMTVIYKPKDYNDEGGEATPVPMMKTLMEKIIEYEAIPPDNSEAAETAVTENGYTVKDYTNTNLKSTIQELVADGIDFEIIGSGDVITKQSPGAGTRLDKKVEKLLFTISASENAKLVPVPDVTGLEVEEAQKLLESAGFVCSVTNDSAQIQAQIEQAKENATAEGTIEESEETTQSPPETVSDTDTPADAKVYVQMPSANVKVESGTTIKVRVK